MASDDDTSPRTSPVPSPLEKPKGAPRKKKSALQTEVLERAYAVEKYPSEATRSLLGKELDLSDKQLQIWFTHRRFKDRRDGIHDEKLTFYAKNKTADHSHHKATTESSKKQQQQQQQQQQQHHEVVTNNVVEEEEDSEPDGYPARVLAEERDDVELIAEHNGMDSNGGYLAEVSERVKPGPKRKGGGGGSRTPKDPYRPPQRPGPKPKFNPMVAAERAAITAVESQLCGPLREDGPPLGFEFDPLPPRAFSELPITDAPQTGGGSRESGSENHSERAALQHKWGREIGLAEKEQAEKKRRKTGMLKPGRGENGY